MIIANKNKCKICNDLFVQSREGYHRGLSISFVVIRLIPLNEQERIKKWTFRNLLLNMNMNMNMNLNCYIARASVLRYI